VETIKRQTRAVRMAVHRTPKSVGAGLAYGLQAIRPLCLWRTAPLQQQLPLVALYKCYAYTVTFTDPFRQTCFATCASRYKMKRNISHETHAGYRTVLDIQRFLWHQQTFWFLLPVNSATVAATFSANPTRVFNPVPTAVPPMEQAQHNDWISDLLMYAKPYPPIYHM